MSKLKFLPPERPAPDRLSAPELPSEQDEALSKVRQRSRNNLKDIVWVAAGLAIILIGIMVYQGSHDHERRLAERQAQLRAATAPALPPPGYDRSSTPTAGDLEADANVREARALVSANAAQNAADPMLNPQKQGAPAAPMPMSPKPFSDPYYTGGGPAAPAPAAATPPPPAPVPAQLPAGPPR
jgi:hypothetical protein